MNKTEQKRTRQNRKEEKRTRQNRKEKKKLGPTKRFALSS